MNRDIARSLRPVPRASRNRSSEGIMVFCVTYGLTTTFFLIVSESVTQGLIRMTQGMTNAEAGATGLLLGTLAVVGWLVGSGSLRGHPRDNSRDSSMSRGLVTPRVNERPLLGSHPGSAETNSGLLLKRRMHYGVEQSVMLATFALMLLIVPVMYELSNRGHMQPSVLLALCTARVQEAGAIAGFGLACGIGYLCGIFRDESSERFLSVFTAVILLSLLLCMNQPLVMAPLSKLGEAYFGWARTVISFYAPALGFLLGFRWVHRLVPVRTRNDSRKS